ncbi:MAG: O-methyltransferase [Bacteroidota bacterium]
MITLPYHCIQAYAAHCTTAPSPLLATLEKETQAHIPGPEMLSGHLQGRLLAMLSRMIQPRNILEIGTYTGYATLCLAEGLDPAGCIYTIDKNAALASTVRAYWTQAGIAQQVKYYIGLALDVIPQLAVTFDLVFIDADKKNYARYYALALDRLRAGGFMIIDNVLWKGQVLPEQGHEIDKRTQRMIDFNTQVHRDPRVENVLLPVRDGLLVVRKK